MKRYLLLFLTPLLLVGCNLKNDIKDGVKHMNTELIIAFKDNVTKEDRQDILNKINASIISDSGSTVIVDASNKTDNGVDICTYLKQSDKVVDCVFNFTEEISATPYDNFE